MITLTTFSCTKNGTLISQFEQRFTTVELAQAKFEDLKKYGYLNYEIISADGKVLFTNYRSNVWN